jgi:hypothetical protein
MAESCSIPDAQPDPFYQLLQRSPSTQSPLPQKEFQTLTYREYAPATSRDDRIAIQTALLFKIPHKKIRKVLKVTESQIEYAREHRVTPQKCRCGQKPLIKTPQRNRLEQWLLKSPSHRRMKYESIPRSIPELSTVREQAIKTAFDLLGYCRRASKKKGFSENPDVMTERVAFAEEGLTWTRERVENQIFSDKVWAMGGPFTTSYVTVKKDGSDRYLPENL